MIKYVSKFAMDILPSVAATIIGAYIVNHYINAKPGTDLPVAAAVSTADPRKVDLKANAKPAETSADVANIPEAGVRAKGISEKAIFDKSMAEKPQDKAQEKSVDKSADKPAETASIPVVDTRRHQPPAPKEKTVIRTIPLTASPTVQPAASVAAPVVAAPTPAPAVEAAIVPEERRDANDLARAAIERLRGSNDGASHADASPRAQDAVRVPDAARVPDPPRIASAPPVRPLPPPIMVSTSPADSTTVSTQANPPYPAAARVDDPRRPVPPADIPDARPLDLQAEASEAPPARPHTTVAQDVLSGVKSVFHSVLPQ